MPARWNQMVAENDPYAVEITPEGRRQGVRMAFCDEDIDMFRVGYKCIDCLEPLENAFPAECPVCSFPVKALQAEVFAERFAGYREQGSRIREGDELERLARQRDERERREGLKAKGIVIPANARL